MVSSEPQHLFDRIARWVAFGAISAGLIGGVGGIVFGLMTNPATAWFAFFEVGVPLAFAGGLIGLVAGTIAQGVAVHGRGNAGRPAAGRRTESQWPYVVVAVGELAVLGAVWRMDWATRVDGLGKETFTTGPTRLLVTIALGSFLLSLVAVVVKSYWPRWLLLATTIVTAVTAVAVALSRIAAANSSDIVTAVGTSTTSYEPGAVVGVGAAFISAGIMLVSLLISTQSTNLATSGYPPPPHVPTLPRTRPRHPM